MKRILILCDIFPPAFGPRMGYLCKYIRALGWQPTVVTEQLPAGNFQFLAGLCEVHEVSFYSNKHPFIRKAQWWLSFLCSSLFDYKNWKMRRAAERLIRKEHFDVLLCSTYRTFPLPAAKQLAEKYRIPFVIDLRDIIEQYSGDEFISRKMPKLPLLQPLVVHLFRQRSLQKRNLALSAADAVTTVSRWHVDTLRSYNPHVQLIYNGFDPEIFYPKHVRTSRFTITYTGRLLSTAMRDPSLLFESLRHLSSLGKLSPENCRVDWYIDEVSWKIIRAEALRYGVLPFMEMKGFVAATQIPDILNSSSVILLLTNKSGASGPKGVMTTKLFEALAVRKPILCVRNDEGVLEEALKEANAGLAANNAEEVSGFLMQNFSVWQQQGYTEAATRPEVLQKYSRKEQAGQFAALFHSIIP